jgi:hypothetical protein
MDLVNAIITYEEGEATYSQYLELFSYLIKTGMVWTLQGSYQRTAADLIESGAIDLDGTILVAVQSINPLLN